jgi:hypothetical protein
VQEADAPLVCAMLHDHLAPDGVVVLVGESRGPSLFWESLLRTKFSAAQTETVDDPVRPYRIIIFEAAAQG